MFKEKKILISFKCLKCTNTHFILTTNKDNRCWDIAYELSSVASSITIEDAVQAEIDKEEALIAKINKPIPFKCSPETAQILGVNINDTRSTS